MELFQSEVRLLCIQFPVKWESRDSAHPRAASFEAEEFRWEGGRRLCSTGYGWGRGGNSEERLAWKRGRGGGGKEGGAREEWRGYWGMEGYEANWGAINVLLDTLLLAPLPGFFVCDSFNSPTGINFLLGLNLMKYLLRAGVGLKCASVRRPNG